MPRGRLLYLDAYDSFSNNIVSLIEEGLPVTVEVIRIDDPRFVFNDDAFRNFLTKFDAVVAGPGPGHPGNVDDVGLIGKLWTLPEAQILPVLGICLGFQSLALAFGATVRRLNEPRHGLIREITHCKRDIFAQMDEMQVTQYHSLHAVLGLHNPAQSDLWDSTAACPYLAPLAWDLSDAKNGPILMAVRHVDLPFWGVQFHPESICSASGSRIVEAWWRETSSWLISHKRELPQMRQDSGRTSFDGPPTYVDPPMSCEVVYRAVKLSTGADNETLRELIRETEQGPPILLESGCRWGKPLNPETGRFSIFAVHDSISTYVRWSTSGQLLQTRTSDGIVTQRAAPLYEVYGLLESLTAQRKAVKGCPDLPFWGGFVGFVSYEAGLETIKVQAAHCSRPDIWFVFAERSVVVDHLTQTAYVQSIRRGDDAWVLDLEQKLGNMSSSAGAGSRFSRGIILSEPTQAEYCRKVRVCQEHLREGSSYELCLTDQTLIQNHSSLWSLYQDVRRTNPAPFGVCMRLSGNGHSVNVVGSSPERFLSWSRDGICQFRPIKGTVKKTPDMTREKAEELLNCEKERAENLMIVDLIRHDLHGVEGVKNVNVPKLMVVEEYETVYQLVSVIEGDLGASKSRIAALSQALPPGSMTGAPKKRSCELLQELEDHKPRGLYSGVIGYLDVGGGADFSVVIRTAFKWDDEDVWRIGAGGAITALSEAEAEWQEMLAKRERLLSVFAPSIEP
ncbi:Anthranilate synthase component I, N terminal region [Teratosphaeria destructans]|uniref:aminodeoxychorismate synthase n=1 Tax=Teratosphaeria destructans TaxID=418781 RepID=A0A9W7W3Z2_9PEZI|nr:Anthranilate synthase component I, N terminal region [Teratosphaeria destructans]